MLTFVFDGKCGKMEVPEKLISGTYGAQVLLKFSSDWDELQKTAVFLALDGSKRTAYSTDVVQDILEIPAAVLENPEHTLYVQVQGFSPDGTEIINTGRVKGPRILPGIDAGELPEMDAKNPVWYEVLSQMGNLSELETANSQSLVSAINELALREPEAGASAYEIAKANGYIGSEAQWLESLSGKNAYEYALDAGFIGSEEEFAAELIGNNDICIVGLATDDNDNYTADKTYYEIAHAHALNKLVLLKYGIYITHILAGELTEECFLFEPLLHSVPGMPGYIVDKNDNWNNAPLTQEAEEPVNDNYIVVLEQDDCGKYTANASYFQIAETRAVGKLVLLRYGIYITHILAGAPTDSSFLFEPLLHSIPGIRGYIVNSEDVWEEANPTTEESIESDVFIGTESTTVTEFNEAFASGKPCFLMKATAGAGITMWVAYSCGTSLAYFYRVAPDGSVQYGSLDSEGTFTYKTAGTSGSGESNVFIGGNDTTLAEFKAAYGSGKTCFLRRSNPSGAVTYTAYNVTSTNAFFFAINTTGAIEYAYLDSNNVFTAQERKHVTSIDENSTDDQIPTAKAVYEFSKNSGQNPPQNGEDGFSPIANVTPTADGATINITDANGTTTATIANGKDGADGNDYVLTDDDRSEIAALVIKMLGGNPIFGIVDENNNIIVSGNLPDGTYSVKYEMENGSTVNIGNLVLDTNVYYSVTNTLNNCVSSNSATQAVQGGSYFASITAKSGYELKTVTVTMGGSPVTVNDGSIIIANVVGDIFITAVAEEIKATYTNLAKNFTTGRFRSSGAIDTGTAGATICEDYIPFTPGTVVRVKGFGALTDYNCVRYQANVDSGTLYAGIANATVDDTYNTYSYDSATGIVTLTSVRSDFAYIRFSGKLTGTTADVIITVNEEIV